VAIGCGGTSCLERLKQNQKIEAMVLHEVGTQKAAASITPRSAEAVG